MRRPVASRPKCGTNAGYQVHMKASERPCPECRAAQSGYATARRHGLSDVRNPPRHGTARGVVSHWIADEPSCSPCAAWHRAYRRGLNWKKVDDA